LSSINPELLKNLTAEVVETKLFFIFGNEDLIKALGLLWNTMTDKLIFCVSTSQDNPPTKRSA
jgi:hypothetical protein